MTQESVTVAFDLKEEFVEAARDEDFSSPELRDVVNVLEKRGAVLSMRPARCPEGLKTLFAESVQDATALISDLKKCAAIKRAWVI